MSLVWVWNQDFVTSESFKRFKKKLTADTPSNIATAPCTVPLGFSVTWFENLHFKVTLNMTHSEWETAGTLEFATFPQTNNNQTIFIEISYSTFMSKTYNNLREFLPMHKEDLISSVDYAMGVYQTVIEPTSVVLSFYLS